MCTMGLVITLKTKFLFDILLYFTFELVSAFLRLIYAFRKHHFKNKFDFTNYTELSREGIHLNFATTLPNDHDWSQLTNAPF